MNDSEQRNPNIGPRSHEDRRQHARFPLEIEVTFASEHNFFTGFAENISEGGLFIATHQLKEVGARFNVKFSLAGVEEPFDILCEVRWIRPYHEGLDVPAGMGVRFVELDESTAAAVTAFIRTREPIFYDD